MPTRPIHFPLVHAAVAALVALPLLSVAAIAAPAATGGDAALALASPATVTALVRLRDRVTVDDKLVTLGDLFEGLDGAAATKPFAVAPAPGQQASFRVDQVAAAARAAGMNWEPTGDQRLVSVSRTARFVPPQDILDRLSQAIGNQSGDRAAMVQISGRMPQLAVAVDTAPTVRVDELQYDPRSGRFSAVLQAPADDADARRVPVQGQVTQAMQVPVPAGRIDPGQVIKKSDLQWVDLAANRVDRNAVTDAAELIGKAAKRALSEGRPIHSNDIERPALVLKGALVTVTLEAPHMSLSTVGRAIESGSKGDFVQVLNMQSHKTIVGTVVGPNLIAIQNSRVVSVAN